MIQPATDILLYPIVNFNPNFIFSRNMLCVGYLHPTFFNQYKLDFSGFAVSNLYWR